MKNIFSCSVYDATPLTISVLENGYYGEGDQEELINTILEEVFRRYSKYCLADDLTDFLLSFRNRINRMINRYEFYGVPFEHYLLRVVRLNLRKYRVRQQKISSRVGTSLSYNPDIHTPTSQQPSFDIFPVIFDMLGVPERAPCLPLKAVQRKRLLIVSCKLVHCLTTDQIDKIAKLTEQDYEKTMLIFETVRGMVMERFYQHSMRTERRNRLYSQLLQEYHSIHKMHLYVSDENAVYNGESNPHERLRVLQKRLRWYNKHLSHTDATPTNKIIATVLNVPKGTVDNIVANFKKRYNQLCGADNIRYTFADEDSYCYK